MSARIHHSPFNIVVLAAGLGFFIDTFDIFLFNVYRVASLKELGLSGEALTRAGEYLLSMQMLGMMIGGVLSGVIADRKGRVSVLFGSIVLYSIANICNGFVQDVDTYAVIRFLAGMGLAGELGAGITLVGESMSIEKRGYGTILVATLGGLGAVTAGLAGDFLPWRSAFIAAGIVGFLLLLLRVKAMETSIFKSTQKSEHPRGSFLHLFRNRKRAWRYIACIIMGVPIWFTVGILITLSPELANEGGLDGWKLTTAFTLFQLGITTGDLSSGITSQLARTRKRTMLVFMGIAILATAWFFHGFANGHLPTGVCFLMGLGCGYLSVFVTTIAEHFGTNLRALVTSTVTNFMRGSVTIMIPFHLLLERYTTLWWSLLITGVLVWALAIISTVSLRETYGRDLDFTE